MRRPSGLAIFAFSVLQKNCRYCRKSTECCRKSAGIAQNLQSVAENLQVLQKVCRRREDQEKTGNKQVIKMNTRYKSHSNGNNRERHERGSLDLIFSPETNPPFNLCTSARAKVPFPDHPATLRGRTTTPIFLGLRCVQDAPPFSRAHAKVKGLLI